MPGQRFLNQIQLGNAEFRPENLLKVAILLMGVDLVPTCVPSAWRSSLTVWHKKTPPERRVFNRTR